MRALLITAGATHNPIDSMRSITAHASGKTGAWFAHNLYQDYSITFLGSSLAIANNTAPVQTEEYTSTRDLESKMKDWVTQNPNGVVIHSAAVGDYEVKDAGLSQKIPSGQAEIQLTLTPAPKILPQLAQWSSELSIISFKAAPPHTTQSKLLDIARAQCLKSGSAVVFANVIGQTSRDVMLVSATHHECHSERLAAMNALLKHIKSGVKFPSS